MNTEYFKSQNSAWDSIAEAVKEREKTVTLPEEEEKQEEKPSQKKKVKKEPENCASRRTAVSLSRPLVSTLWSYHYYLVHRKNVPVRSMEALIRRLLDRELARDPEARAFLNEDRRTF